MRNEQMVQTTAPGLLKLGACLIYEALAVIALGFACTLFFLWLAGDATHGIKRYQLQIFLWIAVGMYFVWCWLKGGQTLAMRAWQLKLVRHDAQLLPLPMAIARYVLASMGLILFGFGFLWAIIDRDKLFLHDRLLKTRIIYVPRNTAS